MADLKRDSELKAAQRQQPAAVEIPIPAGYLQDCLGSSLDGLLANDEDMLAGDAESVRAALQKLAGMPEAFVIRALVMRADRCAQIARRQQQLPAGDESTLWPVRQRRHPGEPWGRWQVLTTNGELEFFRDLAADPNTELRLFRALPARDTGAKP